MSWVSPFLLEKRQVCSFNIGRRGANGKGKNHVECKDTTGTPSPTYPKRWQNSGFPPMPRASEADSQYHRFQGGSHHRCGWCRWHLEWSRWNYYLGAQVSGQTNPQILFDMMPKNTCLSGRHRKNYPQVLFHIAVSLEYNMVLEETPCLRDKFKSPRHLKGRF